MAASEGDQWTYNILVQLSPYSKLLRPIRVLRSMPVQKSLDLLCSLGMSVTGFGPRDDNERIGVVMAQRKEGRITRIEVTPDTMWDDLHLTDEGVCN
jgi:hypothetical protein